MSRNSELAQIHIAKKDLGMDDDTYRMMLQNITGKKSTKEMDIQDRYQVLSHLKNIGWKPEKKNGKRYSPQSKHKKPHLKDQRDKIRALWIDMYKNGLIRDGSETALNHWVARMTARYNKGKGIASVEWLVDVEIAQRVLEALKQWSVRLQTDAQKKGVNVYDVYARIEPRLPPQVND